MLSDLLSPTQSGFKHGSPYFFNLVFTPCKDEQPLQVMELQEKEGQTD